MMMNAKSTTKVPLKRGQRKAMATGARVRVHGTRTPRLKNSGMVLQT